MTADGRIEGIERYAARRRSEGAGWSAIAAEFGRMGLEPQHFYLNRFTGGTERIHGSLLRRWGRRKGVQ